MRGSTRDDPLRCNSLRATSSGVTLLELMFALTIIAILGALAVPSFRNLYHDAGRVAAVNDFLHSLMLARSEAIMRGVAVSLCKSSDGSRCTNDAPDWNAGWIVFANLEWEDPPVRSEAEPVLQVYAGWRGGHITSNRAAYSFRPFMQAVINGTVTFCDPRGSATARALIITNVGRARLAQRDSSNKPLRCPAG